MEEQVQIDVNITLKAESVKEKQMLDGSLNVLRDLLTLSIEKGTNEFA